MRTPAFEKVSTLLGTDIRRPCSGNTELKIQLKLKWSLPTSFCCRVTAVSTGNSVFTVSCPQSSKKNKSAHKSPRLYFEVQAEDASGFKPVLMCCNGSMPSALRQGRTRDEWTAADLLSSDEQRETLPPYSTLRFLPKRRAASMRSNVFTDLIIQTPLCTHPLQTFSQGSL